MIVMKFGGTSVEDANALRNVCQIIADRQNQQPLVVVSACAGVTNALLQIAHSAGEGNIELSIAGIEKLRLRHTAIAEALLHSHVEEIKQFFALQFGNLTNLMRSVAVIQEVTPRLLDQCAAHGEEWSAWLLTFALQEQDIRAHFCNAREVMITNDTFTKAEPQFDLIESRAKEKILPLVKNEVVVTQGFVGATQKGVTTTLGRGGSDFSAAIFGAVLDATEIQIWTDVDGILTTDPNILSDARLVKEVTFGEAAELAYFGAKVLHPSTILPAMKKNIPVRVLNSKRPHIDGTLITAQSKLQSDLLVKSIAYKKNITVITIQSTRMLMAYGFLARVFEVFKHYQKSIDVVATSEVGVSLTIDDPSNIETIVKELQEFADVTVEKNKAVMCVVGEKMKSTGGIAGKIFMALGNAGVNVELISHGGSEINLTFVINESQTAVAVKALHAELF